MSSESELPLIIEAGRSRRLAAFLLTGHAAALGVCLVLPIPLTPRLLLVGVILASLADSLFTHAWRRSARAVVTVEAQPGRPWVLHLRSGSALPARLLSSSFVHPRLLVLNFRTGRLFGRSVVLPEDAADPDLLRQLRVRLLCGDAGERTGSGGNILAR